jgi:hypothetical protein
MIRNVECLSTIDRGGVITWSVECAGREEIGVVSLPEADVDVKGRCKGGYFHVVGPLARLSHLLHMVFKLLLQLLLGVVCCINARRHSSRGPAFRVSSHIIHSHVLAIKVRVVSHVFDGCSPQDLVHLLVAVELVGQGVEQAVALDACQPQSQQLQKIQLTIASYLACIEGIGLEHGKLW